MKKENAFMVLFVLLITILIVLLCVAPVFAQDEMPPEEEPIEEPIDEPVEEEPVEVDPWEGIEAPLGDCIGNGCGEPIEFIVEGCTNPKAVNFLGDWEGWTMVDDGSCICMDIVLDEWGNVLSLDEVDCGKANNSFNDWMAWDYNQNLLPDETAYFEMIDIEGCTDKEAVNYLDPIYWDGYVIIEDGSCVYDIPFEYNDGIGLEPY